MPKNAALLLIGHGSSRYPGAGDLLHRHADALRRAGHCAAVGLLNGSPSVADAVQALPAIAIRVVPFFMEDGYFTRVAIPRALGDRPVHLCPPVGIHPAISGMIEHQAAAACASLGIAPGSAAVVLIGHGSASAPGRRLALHDHATAVAATRRFAQVETACLEEAPFVADILRRLRGYPVIAIGYFANLASHVREDVPALLDAEQAERGGGEPTVHFVGNVTENPAMVDIILDQAGFSDTGGE
ncbi:MAG TPA: CbiX/SirB N-terminal domain-containing protein [Rhodopila sp.]|nr:CbiX/SirB N-terminal domain-containing protein [Rhodopila sp.]